MVNQIIHMKTLIEIATGNIVDTGDMITVNGVKQPLKDIDVPKLVADGILAFAQYTSPNPPAVDPVKDLENTADWGEHEFPMFEISNPKLKSVFLDWGVNKGYDCEQCILNALQLLWDLHPVSLLQIALKQLSYRLNDPEEMPATGYVIGLGDCEIHQIKASSIKTFDHFAFFDRAEDASYALRVCKELTDELF